MSTEKFLLMLFIVSVLTSLSVEGLKKLLDERKKRYYANTLAAIMSVIISIFIYFAYVVLFKVILGLDDVVYIVSLVFLSWLCAMLGYDKVIQAITQFKR